MKRVMYKIDEVANLIKQGKNLLLAGDEELLKKLPDGNWIGGSIPYFMTEKGGVMTKGLILVDEVSSVVEEIKMTVYDIATVKNIYKDGFANGFTVVILPASSETHLYFAINAPDFKEFATKPVIGWISGVFLEDLGKITPKTFLGSGKSISDKNAVAIHCKLPNNKYADISIVNIFSQGTGSEIEFPESGFKATDAIINGKRQNFAEYAINQNLDVRLPLVADYSGTMINISFQSIDKEQKEVNFYAPVFKGVKYRQAAAVSNYIQHFTEQVCEINADKITFSCNCILNYLYSELEGKRTGEITGPITFGEIAYQLLNQTMVSLEIKDI